MPTDTNPDAVKVLTDDERLEQIRGKQSYRAEWAYGDDIEFLLSLNTVLRNQLAQAQEKDASRADDIGILQRELAQVTQERNINVCGDTVHCRTCAAAKDFQP